MKRFYIVTAFFFAIVAVVSLALVRRIPHDGYQGPRSGEDLLKLINRDRPSNVGNEDAESLLSHVEAKSVVPATGLITLTDETFSAAYDEVYDNREKYYGREVSITGYAITDNLPPGQFLVGRDLVWCCQQDKYFIGFLVLTGEALPASEAELCVNGVMEAVPYEDPETGKKFDVPGIRAKKIVKAPGVARDVYPVTRYGD